MIVDDGDLARCAELLNNLELRKAELDVEIGALRGQIAAALDVGQEAVDRAGRPLYRLAPGRRTFKQALAVERLPDDLRDRYTVGTIDGAALKKDSTSLWEACTVQGDPFLVVVR
jgi:hypothetical protein